MRKVLSLFFPFCIAIGLAGGAAAQGIITTIAGNGVTQYIGDGSPATAYSLAMPYGMCIDKHQRMFIADYANLRLRILSHDTLYTMAGNGTIGYFGDGGPASAATFNYTDGVCLDTAGNLYVTDLFNDVVRVINASTGIITTVCGSGGGGYGGDGGPATAANLETPRGACLDAHGNIYIPDFGNHRIRKVTIATGLISTYAGNGFGGYSGDGGPATLAQVSYPNGVCTDAAGNLYISDGGNNTIRKVDANTGVITTVAGTSSPGYWGDGGPATSAGLWSPNNVFADKHGNLFISDFANNVVREVKPSGIIYTVAGSGIYGYSGDGGFATFAAFNGPQAVYVDDSDYLYISDGSNSAIRKVTPRTSAVEDLNGTLSFNVYPNPSDGKFSICLNGFSGTAKAVIYDIMGRIVYENNLSGSKADVALEVLPTGIYQLKIITPYGIQAKKIEINK